MKLHSLTVLCTRSLVKVTAVCLTKACTTFHSALLTHIRILHLEQASTARRRLFPAVMSSAGAPSGAAQSCFPSNIVTLRVADTKDFYVHHDVLINGTELA